MKKQQTIFQYVLEPAEFLKQGILFHVFGLILVCLFYLFLDYVLTFLSSVGRDWSKTMRLLVLFFPMVLMGATFGCGLACLFGFVWEGLIAISNAIGRLARPYRTFLQFTPLLLLVIPPFFLTPNPFGTVVEIIRHAMTDTNGPRDIYLFFWAGIFWCGYRYGYNENHKITFLGFSQGIVLFWILWGWQVWYKEASPASQDAMLYDVLLVYGIFMVGFLSTPLLAPIRRKLDPVLPKRFHMVNEADWIHNWLVVDTDLDKE